MLIIFKGHLVVMASAAILHERGGVCCVMAPCGCQGHSRPPWRPGQKAPVLCWLGGFSLCLWEIKLSMISQCDG